MQRSETLAALATALAKAQPKIKIALKDSTNPHFRSKYADLGQVWAACREALNSNGLSVVQLPTEATDGRTALETILLHESGEFISSVVSTRVAKDDPQGVGSAITYLRRYALAAAVGIVADEDDDGNAASAPVNANPTPAKAKRPDAPSKAEVLKKFAAAKTDAELKAASASIRPFSDLTSDPEVIEAYTQRKAEVK